jgi:hypothetical protein
MAGRKPAYPFYFPERTPYYQPKPGEPQPWAYLYGDPHFVPPAPDSFWGRVGHWLMYGRVRG